MDEQLKAQLRGTLYDIDSVIGDMRQTADAEGIRLMEMRYPDGKWVVADLLVAKAQTLNALAILSRK